MYIFWRYKENSYKLNLNVFSFLTFACLHGKLVRKETVFY